MHVAIQGKLRARVCPAEDGCKQCTGLILAEMVDKAIAPARAQGGALTEPS